MVASSSSSLASDSDGVLTTVVLQRWLWSDDGGGPMMEVLVTDGVKREIYNVSVC